MDGPPSNPSFARVVSVEFDILAASQISSKYSRTAIDCLMKWPLPRDKIGNVPGGLPDAVIVAPDRITGVIFKCNELRSPLSARYIRTRRG